VDILLLMIEMGHPDDPEILSILNNIERVKKTCILVINKIDLGSKERLLPIIEKYRQKYPFDAIFPVSALQYDGIDRLLDELKSRLRPGPQFYPEDMDTDQPESFLVSEIIRERIFSLTRKELPYSSAVTVDKMEKDPKRDLISISACIHVEADSQKPIFIGNRGRMIKSIGIAARRELEKMFGKRVYLDLIVRVDRNWTKDTKAMRRFGY